MQEEPQQEPAQKEPVQTGGQGETYADTVAATQLRQQFVLQIAKESIAGLFAVTVLFCLIYLIICGVQRIGTPPDGIPLSARVVKHDSVNATAAPHAATAKDSGTSGTTGHDTGTPASRNPTSSTNTAGAGTTSSGTSLETSTATSTGLSIAGLLQIVIPLFTLVFGYYSNKVSSDAHIQTADARANAADARASTADTHAASQQQRTEAARRTAEILAAATTSLANAAERTMQAHTENTREALTTMALQDPHATLRETIAAARSAVDVVRGMR